MHPYRIPGRPAAAPPPPPVDDDRVVGAVLAGVGAIPLLGAAFAHAALRGDATVGLVLVAVGALGVVRPSGRTRRAGVSSTGRDP